MNINQYSKGQAILFAVVGVTVALAIGVTVASRNLTSSSRVSRTDSSSIAYAAAEGGIERLLALSDSALNNLSLGNPNCTAAGFQNGPTGYCRMEYAPSSGDSIPSVAILDVEVNSAANSIIIQNGFTKEIVLYDGSYQYPNTAIKICWRNPKAALFYYSYNIAGNVTKGGLFSTAALFTNFPYIFRSGDTFLQYDSADLGSTGFPYCRDVTIRASSYGLRIRALYEETEVGVFPTSGRLPRQGYKLTSVGKVGQTNEVSKTVIVFRSSAYMPSFFDSAIYSSEGQLN